MKSIEDMMKAAQEAAQTIQKQMEEAQGKLDTIEVEGVSGGGLVKVTLSGKGVMTALDIDASLLKPDEKDILEDLILAAIRDGQIRGNDRAQAEMARIAEEMGLPPGMSLPG